MTDKRAGWTLCPVKFHPFSCVACFSTAQAWFILVPRLHDPACSRVVGGNVCLRHVRRLNTRSLHLERHERAVCLQWYICCVSVFALPLEGFVLVAVVRVRCLTPFSALLCRPRSVHAQAVIESAGSGAPRVAQLVRVVACRQQTRTDGKTVLCLCSCQR